MKNAPYYFVHYLNLLRLTNYNIRDFREQYELEECGHRYLVDLNIWPGNISGRVHYWNLALVSDDFYPFQKRINLIT